MVRGGSGVCEDGKTNLTSALAGPPCDGSGLVRLCVVKVVGAVDVPAAQLTVVLMLVVDATSELLTGSLMSGSFHGT